MSQLVKESDLPPPQRALVQKAEQAVRANNSAYAVQLLLPVVKQVPHFLEGRKKLRRAAVLALKAAGGKSLGGNVTGGLAVVKFQSRLKKEPAETLLPELEDLLAADPHSIAGNQMLFELATTLDMPDTAIFALQTIGEGHPEDTKSRHQLAEFYLKLDEPSKAVEVFQKIIAIDPTDSLARKGFTNTNARASIKNQGWSENQSLRALLADSNETRKLESDAKVGVTREQLERRLAELSTQYAEDQANPTIVRRIAETYEQLDDLPNAVQWFEYSASLSPGDSSLLARIDVLNEKKAEKEIKELEELIEKAPNDPETESRKIALEELIFAKLEKSISAARDRVDRNPTDPIMRFELAQALHAAGKFTEAIPELQRAKNNAFIKSKASLLLAKCFNAKNMHDMALKQLVEVNQEIQGMDATKKGILYMMGLLYEKLGQKTESIDCLKQIYEVDYDYEDVAHRVESSYGN